MTFPSSGQHVRRLITSLLEVADGETAAFRDALAMVGPAGRAKMAELLEAPAPAVQVGATATGTTPANPERLELQRALEQGPASLHRILTPCSWSEAISAGDGLDGEDLALHEQEISRGQARDRARIERLMGELRRALAGPADPPLSLLSDHEVRDWFAAEFGEQHAADIQRRMTLDNLRLYRARR